MSDPKMPRWQHWAGSFAVIGSFVQSAGKWPTAAGVAGAGETLSAPLVPDKRISEFSTIERWYHAKDAPDPITALGQKPRVDAGRRWR